ncbi:MAG TPA: hypothetical protein VMU29_14720 [Smithella sp.]|nr:hypothetical protein [Smithella sp.]
MKHFRTVPKVILAAALFSICPQALFAASAASTEEGHSITLPQLLILVFILGLYLYNHFKEKIKARFSKKK